MRLEAIKKSEGSVVRLSPPRYHLDPDGQSLGQYDDDWVVGKPTERGVPISSPASRYSYTLGLDHIHDYKTDPDNSPPGTLRGVLTLNVQLYSQGHSIRFESTRPGEPRLPRPGLRSIRRALLEALHQRPGAQVHPNGLEGFEPVDVMAEIVRSRDQGLVDAQVLKEGNQVVAAVALGLKPAGAAALQR